MKTTGKIRVGIVAFHPGPTFEETLKLLSNVSDSITVVYGRFNDFPHPYIPPPDFIEKYAELILCDSKHTQHEQRDLYLHNVETGDTLFVVDSDWIPSNPNGIKQIHNMENNESSFLIALINGGFQAFIGTYRFQEGWKHSAGQILKDRQGMLICGPHYPVTKIGTETFFYTHHVRKEENAAYKEAYLKHWDIVCGQ